MGKRLIIKGADFSTNGFTYDVETEVVNDLWYKGTGQGSLVKNTNEDWPVSSSDGKAYYKSNSSTTTYTLLDSVDSLVSNKVAVGDYTHVKVKTLSSKSGGYVILAAIDVDGKCLKGYRTGSEQRDIVLTDVGYSTSVREFEMDLPVGTTHVIASWVGNEVSPFDASNGYTLILSKIAE